MKVWLMLTLSLVLAGCSGISVKKGTGAASGMLSFGEGDLQGPESIVFDTVTRNYFVSNVSGGPTEKNKKGYISRHDETGKVIEKMWFPDMNAPKGMRINGRSLWVTDIDEVFQINIDNKDLDASFKIQGAKFLNDIAIDSKGAVYISDMLDNRIYRIYNNRPQLLAQGEILEGPNGLFIHNNRLYVTSWGKDIGSDFKTKVKGSFYSIDLGTFKKKTHVRHLGNLDGLELMNDGSWVVSDWISGDIYKISQDYKVKSWKNTSKGSADLTYRKDMNMVIVPQMLQNKAILLK